MEESNSSYRVFQGSEPRLRSLCLVFGKHALSFLLTIAGNFVRISGRGMLGSEVSIFFRHDK